jgi:hypothetical protein
VPNVAADRVAYSPPSAAVEEFKIHTTTYDASIGNTMGAVVNLVTKSGSNKLKGQAYEWFRGAKLDAPQYFDKLAGRPKRHYDDNRFGAALGGPVVAGRTFYFANVEGNIWQGPQPITLTVPTAKMRAGDFSELLALGSQYQIYDPATIRPHPTQAGRFTRDPFPGNIIPSNRIDPVAKRIIEYYPLPNQAATTDQRNNYTNPTAVAYETYYTATGRVDHNLSSKHRLYGRFSWDFWEEEKDNRFDNEATGIFLNRKNRILAVDDTFTFRSNLLLNVRGGFTRQLFPERRRSQGFDLASLGFAPGLVSLASKDLATFPNITFDNYQAFSPWETGDGYFTTDVYSAQGNLVWLVGDHSLKFGAENRTYVEDASRFPTSVSPRISFGSGWTRGPLDNSAAAPTGQDMASFLLGYPTGGDMSRSAAYTERSSVWGFYVHDDWRLRGNFTLNAGVRYEIEDPLTEKDGRMITGFDFNTPLPIAATAIANYARSPITEVPVADFKVRGGLLYPDTGGRQAAWGRTLGNIMPRLGFSWVPVEKTAIRGGYGLFYDVLGANRINANHVRRDAGQPVPQRAAGAGRERSRSHDERRFGRELPLCRRCPQPEEPSVFPWGAERAAGRDARRGNVCRLSFRASAGHRRTEPRAETVLLDVPGPRPGDERPPDGGGGEPVLPAAARHAPGGVDRAAPAAAQVVPPVHVDSGARDQRQVGLSRLPGTRRASHGERVHGAGGLHLVAPDDGEQLPEQLRHRARTGDRRVRSHAHLRRQRARGAALRPRPPLGLELERRHRCVPRRLADQRHLEGAERRAARIRQLSPGGGEDRG